jgi:hypothetical protein
MKRLVLFLAILPALASCKKDNDKQLYDRVSGEGLVGNWQLFEEGSSPGAGYYITKIPANPAQMLWFRENGTWESNIRNKPSSGQYCIRTRRFPSRTALCGIKSPAIR